MKKPVIVYGPQGCGKNVHAKHLAAHFGLARISYEFAPGDAVRVDTLHLTNCDPVELWPSDTSAAMLISYDAAMHLAPCVMAACPLCKSDS